MDVAAEPGRLARLAREVAIVGVVAFVQLVPTTFAARRQPEATDLWPWGYLLLAGAVAALPFRHRFPVPAVVAALAFTVTYWGAAFPRGPAFLALFVAVGSIVRRNRRETARTRAEQARRLAQEERLTIAREVHDAVAHTMSLITIQAGVALHRGGDLPAETREALGVIRTASRESLTELRGILGVIRDADGRAPRAPTPGLARIGELRTWAGQVGLDARFELGGLPPLPAAADAAAYRIVQESLTNVVRHAPGASAVVTLERRGDALELTVTDDGAGHPPTAPDPAAGNGIAGMRERAAALGGSLEAAPGPGGGFTVRATIPLAPKEAGR